MGGWCPPPWRWRSPTCATRPLRGPRPPHSTTPALRAALPKTTFMIGSLEGDDMRRQVPFLEPGMPLPDPRAAGRAGLVAVGGDLRPGTLLDAYSKGIFPW